MDIRISEYQVAGHQGNRDFDTRRTVEVNPPYCVAGKKEKQLVAVMATLERIRSENSHNNLK